MPARIAYTTLTEIKRQLGGAGLPPYEPLTPDARAVLNPDFVAGMGALKADAELGIQCPICGRYYLSLGTHVSTIHKAMGGARELKRLLGYPKTAPLVSFATHVRMHEGGKRAWSKMDVKPPRPNHYGVRKPWGQGIRNLALSCRAQMIAHFQTLWQTLGREPTRRDWAKAGLPESFRRNYMTWGELVIAAGGQPHRHGVSLKGVCIRGHVLTIENRYPSGGCKLCGRARDLIRDQHRVRNRVRGQKAAPQSLGQQ